MTADDIIDAILKREGGYVNHPADRGGPTKYGITIATLAAWRGRKQTADDVRTLAEAEARTIYRQRYITDPGLDYVDDDALRALLVDSAVLHGPRRAVMFLQAAVGIERTGNFGPQTRAALQAADKAVVWRRVLGQRLRYTGEIVRDNPSQAVFAAGWANRMAEFLEA